MAFAQLRSKTWPTLRLLSTGVERPVARVDPVIGLAHNHLVISIGTPTFLATAVQRSVSTPGASIETISA